MDLYTKYRLQKLIASQSKRKTVLSFWERLFTSFYGTPVSQWEIYVMSMRSCVLTIFWGLFGFRCCFCLILSIYLPYFCLCFFYCTVNPSERLKKHPRVYIHGYICQTSPYLQTYRWFNCHNTPTYSRVNKSDTISWLFWSDCGAWWHKS